MKKVHFIGIGGAGTSAAAALAKEHGFEVDGCDIDSKSAYLPELEKLNINVEAGHDTSHIEGQDIIVTSAAVGTFDPLNLEIAEAKKIGKEVITTEKFVSDYLAKDKFIIAVSGTHGKSTTTAMVGRILEDAGYDPTVYVGAIVTKWGKNYRYGKGKYFVLEADEYQDKFLTYKPNIGVINNIEYDHPDYFKNEDQLVESFVNFVRNFQPESKLILGTDPEEDKNIEKLVGSIGNVASVIKDHLSLRDFNFQLQISGKHNQLNAISAYLCAEEVGVDEAVIKASLSGFSGTARRFEFNEEVNGVKIFDDYAHHPSEVSATIEAAREKFPNERIWCIFQPHTFSRTKVLFDDFVKSFSASNVDKLIFVDIYASREKNTPDISSLDIAKKVKDSVYIGSLEEAASYVAKNVSTGDVVIAMGAGDIYKFSTILASKLKGQNGRRAS